MGNKSKFYQSLETCHHSDRRLLISIVAVSSPGHYTLWNALAAETLAGDIRGHFSERVEVSVLRVRTENEYRCALSFIKVQIPDILGISVECGGVELATGLVQELLRKTWGNGRNNGCPDIVFGGKIPTYFPELFLSSFPTSLIVLGEGELPFRRVIQRYFDERPEALAHIPNLAFMGQMGDFIRTCLEQPCSSSLVHPPSTDTVPELLAMGAGTLMVQASRGCSWSKCSYCTVSSFRGGKKWETLPWNRTRKHLEALVSLGVREFEFCDDDFLGGRDPDHLERAQAIADALFVLGKTFENGIAFRIFLTPQVVFDFSDQAGNLEVNRILWQLRQAGLARVYFGIESGSEEQLRRYLRGASVRSVVGALETMRSLGVGIDCGFIMFDPAANINDISENIQFFRRHGLAEHNQWPFRPLVANKGAGLGRDMADHGMPPDSSFMCYRYKFRDQHVQRIYDVVDAISADTRSLFYALKVISKSHFDPSSETAETKMAREIVIQNAQIYLDLMDKLVGAIGNKDEDYRISSAVREARYRIAELVMIVSEYIKKGCLRDFRSEILSGISSLPGAMDIFTTHPNSIDLIRSVT
jgi:hypothetical protein